jgi:hypothetical protein
MSLWGQFLNRRGQLHVARAAKLSIALAAASSTNELDGCFPFPVLTAEAPVSAFYDFLGLLGPPSSVSTARASTSAQRRFEADVGARWP